MQKQESTSETYLRCEMRRDPGIIKRHPLFIAFQFLYALARFNLAVKIWTMKHRCKTLSLVILNPCSDMLELGAAWHVAVMHMLRLGICTADSSSLCLPGALCNLHLFFAQQCGALLFFPTKKDSGKEIESKKDGKNAENTSFDRIFVIAPCRL